MPSRCACTSFSIFIASTMQSTCPAVDLVAFRDLDGEHRALHRAHDRVLAAGAAALTPRALAPPARRLGLRRLRLEHTNVVAPALDLHEAHSLPQPGSVRSTRYRCCQM